MYEWWLKYHVETHKQSQAARDPGRSATQASFTATHVSVSGFFFFFFLWWTHIFRVTEVVEELEEVDGIIVIVVENNIFFVAKVRRCKGQKFFFL